MDDRQNYFDYVTGVLGIKSILNEQAAAASAPVPVKLLLAVEGLSVYTAAENELLEKMIAALKMDPKTFRLVDLKEAAGIQRGYTIEFRDEKPTTTVDHVQSVYSPRTLLKTPALKKQAWDDLQKVIRHFSV